MANTYTLADIKTLVQEPLDLEAEDFISDAELTRYINAGIREVQAELQGIIDREVRARGISEDQVKQDN